MTEAKLPERVLKNLFWVPEAPSYPGVYAPVNYERGKVTMTLNIHEAMKFESEDACRIWCFNNTTPVFVPKEHVVMTCAGI